MAQLVRALGLDEIASMKANVIDHYQRYLRPQNFVECVLASPEKNLPVLYYTERNAAKNASKQGRHSILMESTTQPRPGSWFQRILASYLG